MYSPLDQSFLKAFDSRFYTNGLSCERPIHSKRLQRQSPFPRSGINRKMARYPFHPNTFMIKLESDLKAYSLDSSSLQIVIPQTLESHKEPKGCCNLNIMGFKQFIRNYVI